MNLDLTVVRIRTDHILDPGLAEKAKQALAASDASLRAQGWNYRDHRGQLGDLLPADWITQWGFSGTVQGKMQFRPGAWGCLISHYTLWQQCSHDSKPWLILEQDAIALDGPHALSLPLEFSVIKLNKPNPAKPNPYSGQWSKGAHAISCS